MANYNFVITVNKNTGDSSVWRYDNKAAALENYALRCAETNDWSEVQLFLEPIVTKQKRDSKASGYWTDAYGVVRVVPTGVID